MNGKNRIVVSGITLGIALFLCGGGWVATGLSQDFQKIPIVLKASDVLPKEALSGPNYTIKEMIINDGLINTYEIDTQYGLLKLESTIVLLKRINELKALVKIGQLRGTNVYMDALKNSAMGPVKTAKGLVTEPVDTAKGVVSGVGNFFTKVGDAVTSTDPNKDSAINSASGQAAYKREYAYEFGVDPYTTYEPLQKALTDIAWTSAAGGLTTKAAFMAIPGAAGAVVGYSGTAETMRTLVRDKTPSELQKINRDKLRGMGVNDSLANLFLSSTTYSPREKTLLVGALASMTGVKDRGIFMQSAAIDCEESVAMFMRVRAELMALYFEKTKNIDRFVNTGGVPVLLTKNGVIVGIFPLDHVAWTSALAEKEIKISAAIGKMPSIKGKELWISGMIDPVALKALEDRGWKVHDRAQDKILAGKAKP
jgi:hypothetical protein